MSKLVYVAIGLAFLAINVVAGFSFIHCSTKYQNFQIFFHHYYSAYPTDWQADPEFAKNLTYDNVATIAKFLQMHYENELGYSNITASFSFETFSYVGCEVVFEYWIALEQVKPVQVVEMDKIPLACVWSITIVGALTLAFEWAKESAEHEATERKMEESSS